MIRSELDVLLDKVRDEALRAELQKQIDRLKERRSFGLVFERHIPERVRLLQHPIRVGSQVVLRDDVDSPTFEVTAIDDGVATLVRTRDAEGAYLDRGEHELEGTEESPLDALVVISDFGEPVLPGLRLLGTVERGGDKPFHVVINGENHHALEMLRFTHAGKVDCIYIDPPYNSGARDWKYNNDYVDDNDAYRHSKWLAFMERRLRLAKDLLNPVRSVLIASIDENEAHRLALLLEQMFPTSKIQTVTAMINPPGATIIDQFSRVDEHILFVHIGAARPQRTTADTTPGKSKAVDAAGNAKPFEWTGLLRRGGNSRRQDTKEKFFPIYISEAEGKIVGCGDSVPMGVPRETAENPPEGCVAQWPIKQDGSEACWQLSPATFRRYLAEGRIRISQNRASTGRWGLYFLTNGDMKAIAKGELQATGRDNNGALIVDVVPGVGRSMVGKTMWTNDAYNAREHGSKLLPRLIPGRSFPFPKSLYLMEDALRFYVGDQPNAVVLDFFAGSGTTAHAVLRLNKQDSGRRQSIIVTNNEVSAQEAIALRQAGFRPGDHEWESMGIFEHITRPRMAAAISGMTPDGEPIDGVYRLRDEFPMSEGFPENAAFLNLRYLDADQVELGRALEDLAPLLWLRSGAIGPIIRPPVPDGPPFEWTSHYGVLFDVDHWRRFVSERPESAMAAFVATYSATTLAGIAAELPPGMDIARLPETYISMFVPEGGH